MRKPRGYWTKERCQEESLKYNNRSDFNKNSKSAYLSSYRNGWLDDICSHMEIKGSIYKRCIYSYEFSDNSVYVGLTFNIKKRQNNRDYDITDKVTKHINKTKLKPKRRQLTEYVDINDAVKLENYYLNKYKKDGWNILNVSKTGSLGGNIIKWDYEKCKIKSIKYNSRKEFKQKSPGSYFASLRNNWLDDICLHMKNNKQKPKGYWTMERCITFLNKCENLKEFKKKYGSAYNKMIKYGWIEENYKYINTRWNYEKCKEESLKYKNRNGFRINSGGAYNHSRKMGWLDEICDHMVRLRKPKTKKIINL